MATQIVYDLVEPRAQINYARAFDNEILRARFTLQAFLPSLEIPDLEYRIRQGTLQDVDAAEYRAWDTPAPMTGRAGVARVSGELAPLSRQIPLGEEESLRLRSLLSGQSDPIISQIYADTEQMVRAVQARMEIARGQLLTTGKVTIAENGLSLEADYNLAGDHLVSASTAWTDHTNAVPLTNLLTWVDKYNDDSGTIPGTILMSQTRLNDFYLNAEVRAAAASPGFVPSRINRVTLDGILNDWALPPISTYDVKVRVNGVSTRVLPADKVYLLPPADENLGNTLWGITAEAVKLRGKGLIDAEEMPGIVALVTETDHPVQTFTVGTGISLPVLGNPELLMVADVAA
jgi:hypothetical protein